MYTYTHTNAQRSLHPLREDWIVPSYIYMRDWLICGLICWKILIYFSHSHFTLLWALMWVTVCDRRGHPSLLWHIHSYFGHGSWQYETVGYAARRFTKSTSNVSPQKNSNLIALPPWSLSWLANLCMPELPTLSLLILDQWVKVVSMQIASAVLLKSAPRSLEFSWQTWAPSGKKTGAPEG